VEKQPKKPTILTRCNAKNDATLVINERWGRRLGHIAGFLTTNNVPAAFVIDGFDLDISNNFRAHKYRQFVVKLVENGHHIIVKPHTATPFHQLSTEKALKAIRESAKGIQSVLNVHPRLVHPNGGQIKKEQARALGYYSYILVGHKKTIEGHAKGMDKVRKEKPKKVKKHHGKYPRTQHKRSKGYIFYGHSCKGFDKDVEATVKTLHKKGYNLRSLFECADVAPYRAINE
jgi:hypothetical protein